MNLLRKLSKINLGRACLPSSPLTWLLDHLAHPQQVQQEPSCKLACNTFVLSSSFASLEASLSVPLKPPCLLRPLKPASAAMSSSDECEFGYGNFAGLMRSASIREVAATAPGARQVDVFSGHSARGAPGPRTLSDADTDMDRVFFLHRVAGALCSVLLVLRRSYFLWRSRTEGNHSTE